MKDTFWVEESGVIPSFCKRRKRRVRKRKIEFIGWGSRPLVEFLEAIGQDTTKKHSRHDVATFIAKYINDKGLACAEKKKKVLCDERLYALFGKKSVSRIKVFDMLEEHFAENHDDSDSELLESSEEEDYGEKSSLGLKHNSTIQSKKILKKPRSCFAAIIPENIKLVYLKKSLILELLQVRESFESKILGGFVRMKSDPNDIYQKNRFQLQQVTGVEKVSSTGDADSEIHLRVSNFFKNVPISMLSDDNFSEEEIEDLRDRIKAGLLERLTVDKLELKAQTLHADITKHWIERELSLLQKLIDRANEKGWRRDCLLNSQEVTLFEYLERRKTLQTPSEQGKLLLKIPEVIAEEVEPEGTKAGSSEKAEGNDHSPKSTLRGSSDVSSTDASGSGEIVAQSQVIFSDSEALKLRNEETDCSMPVKNSNDHHADFIQREKSTEEKPPAGAPNEVIHLIHDELKVPDPDDHTIRENSDEVIWHYTDPQGKTQGPFSLYMLKRWSDANYFPSGFTVWKTGQPSYDRVLLANVLHRTFPNY